MRLAAAAGILNVDSVLKLIRAVLLLSFGLPALISEGVTPLPAFTDISSSSGITFRHAASKTSQKHLPESMSGGVAMFDYDGDGLLDLFFVNGAALTAFTLAGHHPDKTDPRYWNRLYRNRGDNTFEDVTRAAGVNPLFSRGDSH